MADIGGENLPKTVSTKLGTKLGRLYKRRSPNAKLETNGNILWQKEFICSAMRKQKKKDAIDIGSMFLYFYLTYTKTYLH